MSWLNFPFRTTGITILYKNSFRTATQLCQYPSNHKQSTQIESKQSLKCGTGLFTSPHHMALLCSYILFHNSLDISPDIQESTGKWSYLSYFCSLAIRQMTASKQTNEERETHKITLISYLVMSCFSFFILMMSFYYEKNKHALAGYANQASWLFASFEYGRIFCTLNKNVLIIKHLVLFRFNRLCVILCWLC